MSETNSISLPTNLMMTIKRDGRPFVDATVVPDRNRYLNASMKPSDEILEWIRTASQNSLEKKMRDPAIWRISIWLQLLMLLFIIIFRSYSDACTSAVGRYAERGYLNIH